MIIDVFKHLLPRGRVWNITVDRNLRKLFQGLADGFAAFRDQLDLLWLDLLPESTRELAKWEFQFGLFGSVLTEAQRRDRLAAAWQATGGQSPRYIQDVLQAAGFDVYVHEWWADDVPTVRNPFDYLRDSSTGVIYTYECDEPAAECGEPGFEAGETTDPPGYPLVNLQLETIKLYEMQAGESEAACGEPDAECGAFQQFAEVRREYLIPSDPQVFPYFVYLAGETFPNPAAIPNSRRLEFERLALKICPTHLWIGVIVTYT